MGSVGDAYDNAMCESFFATLECELLDRVRFRTAADARREIFSFIEGFYNTSRLPLGPRLPGACELRGNQPCRVKRPRARATDGPRPLSPPWEGTTGFISDTINHRSQLSVKAGQVQGPPSRVNPHLWLGVAGGPSERFV